MSARSDHFRSISDARDARLAWQRGGLGTHTLASRFRGMSTSRLLLKHFLAALAYRTQKALRDAPSGFGTFRAGPNVRTPHELLWHMTGLMGYARTFFRGGEFAPPPVPTLEAEIVRFHETLGDLVSDLDDPDLRSELTDEQLLQGPLADAMTHVGQLAMLRRLGGAPVPSENFIHAAIRTENVSANQPPPVAPDDWWRPDQAPLPPGPIRGNDTGTTATVNFTQISSGVRHP